MNDLNEVYFFILINLLIMFFIVFSPLILNAINNYKLRRPMSIISLRAYIFIVYLYAVPFQLISISYLEASSIADDRIPILLVYIIVFSYLTFFFIRNYQEIDDLEKMEKLVDIAKNNSEVRRFLCEIKSLHRKPIEKEYELIMFYVGHIKEVREANKHNKELQLKWGEIK